MCSGTVDKKEMRFIAFLLLIALTLPTGAGADDPQGLAAIIWKLHDDPDLDPNYVETQDALQNNRFGFGIPPENVVGLGPESALSEGEIDGAVRSGLRITENAVPTFTSTMQAMMARVGASPSPRLQIYFDSHGTREGRICRPGGSPFKDITMGRMAKMLVEKAVEFQKANAKPLGLEIVMNTCYAGNFNGEMERALEKAKAKNPGIVMPKVSVLAASQSYTPAYGNDLLASMTRAKAQVDRLTSIGIQVCVGCSPFERLIRIMHVLKFNEGKNNYVTAWSSARPIDNVDIDQRIALLQTADREALPNAIDLVKESIRENDFYLTPDMQRKFQRAIEELKKAYPSHSRSLDLLFSEATRDFETMVRLSSPEMIRTTIRHYRGKHLARRLAGLYNALSKLEDEESRRAAQVTIEALLGEAKAAEDPYVRSAMEDAYSRITAVEDVFIDDSLRARIYHELRGLPAQDVDPKRIRMFLEMGNETGIIRELRELHNLEHMAAKYATMLITILNDPNTPPSMAVRILQGIESLPKDSPFYRYSSDVLRRFQRGKLARAMMNTSFYIIDLEINALRPPKGLSKAEAIADALALFPQPIRSVDPYLRELIEGWAESEAPQSRLGRIARKLKQGFDRNPPRIVEAGSLMDAPEGNESGLRSGSRGVHRHVRAFIYRCQRSQN